MTLFIFAAILIIVPALLTVLAMPLVRKFAIKIDMVSRPSSDRFSDKFTPLGGGLAMVLSIIISISAAIACVCFFKDNAPNFLGEFVNTHLPGAATKIPMALKLLAGVAGLAVLGFWDDKKAIKPLVKLFWQIVICTGVCASTNLRVLTLLGEPFSLILTVLWMLTIVNAMNFMDNMDGLSTSVTAIAACALLTMAVSQGQVFVSAWLCILIGACAGFLVFNFYPASIFMGDAGSMVLGFLLAVLSVLTTYYGSDTAPGPYVVFTPLAVMAVPLYDLVTVVCIRIKAGRSPMSGDTNHFSHRLARRGLSVPATVITISLCTAVTGVSAVMLTIAPNWAALLPVGQVVGVLGIIALLEATGKDVISPK